MNSSLTVGAKLAVFLALAIVFGATMIGLSGRARSFQQGQIGDSGNDKHFDKSFTVTPGGKLVIRADEGSITVSGTDSKEVSIHVLARGSESVLKKFDVRFDQNDNTVKVESRFRNNYLNFCWDNDLDVQYDVQVPSDFNLDLITAGGDLTILSVKGKIVGETSGGNLDLSKIDGAVRMTTSGGNVNVRESTGDCKIETSGGSIHGVSIVGSMDFESSGGDIDVKESDGKLRASTSGGNVRVALKDNKGIDLETSGGNLVVRLPKAISADVRAETTGGDVSCDFQFSGKLKDGSFDGKINGGGNLIRLETSGGDIIINSLEL